MFSRLTLTRFVFNLSEITVMKFNIYSSLQSQNRKAFKIKHIAARLGPESTYI